MSEPRYPTVHVEVPAEQASEVSAMLFALGASGVEERDATTLDRTGAQGLVTLVAHYDDEDRARIVVESSPHPARLVPIVGDDWKHRWREFFKPTRVGRRLLVRPPWEVVEPGPDDVVLTIDPGQAFGTGTHETTRLVLAELESIVRGGERVLDVGSGSGILSIGALLFGAERAQGLDIDDESMAAARENAATNGVSARLRVAKSPIGTVRDRFDIVLANIESRVLVPLAAVIASRLDEGGTLVLSGLLAHEEEEAHEAYAQTGLVHRATRAEGEWIAMIWERPVLTQAPKKKVAKAPKKVAKTSAKVAKTSAKAAKAVKAVKKVAKTSAKVAKASAKVAKAVKKVAKTSAKVAKTSARTAKARKQVAKRPRSPAGRA